MDNGFKNIVDELKNTQNLTKEQFAYLLERGDKEDLEYPLQNHYFIKYNGKFIKANELYVLKAIPKSKRKVFWETVREVGFSWIHEDSLMKLLKVISEGSSK